jgi:hypothetical protein
MEQCGRVAPVIEHYIMCKFDDEKVVKKCGLKDWKHCLKEVVEGKHLCAEHLAKPLTVDGKLFLGWE